MKIGLAIFINSIKEVLGLKKISIDCKFTIDIEDKYFDENYQQSNKNKPVTIHLRAEEENVLLEDLVNVIRSCTLAGYGLLCWIFI